MIRQLGFAFALAAAAGSLLGQAPTKAAADPNAAKKPPGNCTVSGRVVSAADGAPLRSARVGLIQANAGRRPQRALVYGATTDSDGHFEIKQIEAGRYHFFASHIEYLEQEYQARGTTQGSDLSLAASQEVSGVLFRLIPACVITGRVVDDGGVPMIGVGVSVFRDRSADEADDDEPQAAKQELFTTGAGVTDDRGEYRIFGLEPGAYYIKAAETADPQNFGSMSSGMGQSVLRELGSQYAPLFYPGVLQMDQAEVVTLQAGQEMQADFAMRRIKLSEVSGKVIGADGSPATGAYVELSNPKVNDWNAELRTDADGRGQFSIKSVPPGSYVLSASQNDHDGHRYSVRQTVEVGETKIDSVVLAIGRGARLQGRIIASGGGSLALDHTQVNLSATSDKERTGSASARVNKDGTFEIEGVSDGSYALMVWGPEQAWFVTSAHLGSEDVFQKGVQVENGAAGGTLEIVIASDGAQLEGTLTDTDQNQPVAGAQIRARPDPETDYNRSRTRFGSTDQNGHFVLKDAPPGKYRVSARIPSSAPGVPAVKSDPVAVTLGDREHRSLDLKVKLPKSE